MLALLIHVSLVVLVVGQDDPITVDPDTSGTGGVLDLSNTDLTTLYCQAKGQECASPHLEAQFAPAVDQCHSRCNRNLQCLEIFYSADKICNLRAGRCTSDQLVPSTGTSYYRLKKGEKCPSDQPPFVAPTIVYSDSFCMIMGKSCPGYNLYLTPQNIKPNLECLKKCAKIKTCAGVDFTGKCLPKDYQCSDAELIDTPGTDNYMRLVQGVTKCPWNRAPPGQPVPVPTEPPRVPPPPPPPAEQEAAVCEGGNLVISCSNGQVLDIFSATYGRSDQVTCSSGPILTTTCGATNSLSVVKSACQNKPSCTVGANNGVFGDPCYGTYKYLHVSYICDEGQVQQTGLPPTDVVVCEGQNLDVVCPGSSVLIINSASYGRSDITQCATGPILTTSCSAANSLSILKSLCEYNNECVLAATNSVFGDPCYGTYKYLAINYKCIDAPAWRDAVACEGGSISMTCSGGQKLNIYAASYGRVDSVQCATGPIQTTSCRADSSLTVVQSACQGKSSCTVSASNGEFGDPCYGTYKYLTATYSCE